jgi:hypothetical protein
LTNWQMAQLKKSGVQAPKKLGDVIGPMGVPIKSIFFADGEMKELIPEAVVNGVVMPQHMAPVDLAASIAANGKNTYAPAPEEAAVAGDGYPQATMVADSTN